MRYCALLLLVVSPGSGRAVEDSASMPILAAVTPGNLPYRLGFGSSDGTLGLGGFGVNEPVTRVTAQTTGATTSPGSATAEPDWPEESASELNRKLTNPVSTIWSLSNQFNNFMLANGHWNNNWNVQPVVSVSLTKDWNLTTRPVMPFMPVDRFEGEVKTWLGRARDPRWKRPYTELTYLPMQEVLRYLRASGYRTYIVTGGGQDFVRVYSEEVYGIPPEQVVGTAGGTKYGYDSAGKPFLTKEPRLLLNDNNAGKPEGIHLMIGRRPYAAFGNSTGDRQMLEYTKGGDGARLAMLVLHDDAKREYAYGPAQGLPHTKVGTFTQALHDEAMKQGWIVISMKNDWKRVFSFEP
jgi:hypothetical protein